MNHMTLLCAVAGVPTASSQAMLSPGRGSYRLRNTLPPLRCGRCVVPGRLELPTSTLSVWRSNQLSYRTKFNLVCLIRPGFLLSLFRIITESYLE